MAGASPLPLLVWHRGRLLPPERARVSALDHAFLYGDSVYETLRTQGGALAFLAEHVARLRRSCELLAMDLPPGVARVSRIVEAARRRLGTDEVTVRIMVTRGPGPITPDPTHAGPPELLVYVRPYVPRPPHHYQRGVTAIIAGARKSSARSLPSEAKTGNFLPHVLAMAEARRAGADEALMLSLDGHLAEGATSNLFWWRHSTLSTPSRTTAILPGITRRVVIELARRAGIRVQEVRARPRALYGADEAFLTNSTGGVIPLVSVDGHRIGGGRVGPRTRDLAARYDGRLAGRRPGAAGR